MSKDKLSMNSRDAFNTIRESLSELYGSRESDSISYLVLEKLYGQSRIDILAATEIKTDTLFTRTIEELLTGKPVQYVIGNADFHGLEFLVDQSVLIPRSETEELVDLIVRENDIINPRILDIGTGSGCIAVSLMMNISGSKATALDVSKDALRMAQKNADRHNVNIEICEMDILTPTRLGPFDIIVSNPPYVRNSERVQMQKHVLDFEPDSALFVEDEDPLIFYKAISDFALEALSNKGRLYLEINEAFGDPICDLLQGRGFTEVKIIKDIHGRDRFAKTLLP